MPVRPSPLPPLCSPLTGNPFPGAGALRLLLGRSGIISWLTKSSRSLRKVDVVFLPAWALFPNLLYSCTFGDIFVPNGLLLPPPLDIVSVRDFLTEFLGDTRFPGRRAAKMREFRFFSDNEFSLLPRLLLLGAGAPNTAGSASALLSSYDCELSRRGLVFCLSRVSDLCEISTGTGGAAGG